MFDLVAHKPHERKRKQKFWMLEPLDSKLQYSMVLGFLQDGPA